MRVLIACEYSGRVREAFRARGHDVISCDFEPAEDESPHHYQGDVFDLLVRQRRHFDLMIAHPPCTYLCNSGGRWLYLGGKKVGHNVDQIRLYKTHDAIDFFKKLREAALTMNPKMKIARENPIMNNMARGAIGKAAQFVQPWWFGEEAFKATGFWLDNLDPLNEDMRLSLRHRRPRPGTDEHKRWSAVHRASPGPDRWKTRSRTFQGIANAMAEQWG